MKKLYQTLTPLLTPLPLINQEFMMLKYPEFLMKIAMDKSPASSGNHICFMDNYQHQQLNLIKQIRIKSDSSLSEFL